MSLARNAIFNFIGALAPALAALLTVPVLVAHLGTAEYGVLVLITAIVGYFAVLDVNVTAGSVKYIAEYNAQGDAERVRQVLSFGAGLYLAIGVVGGTLIAVFAEALATGVFRIPPESHASSVLALRWAGAAFVVAQLQVFLQSVPQALERYDVTGKLESGFGTAASVASMLAALAGGGLVAVVLVRFVLSLANVALLIHLIRRLLPAAGLARPARAVVRALAGFSAYSYLARLAAISAANTDKLLIGAMVDMRALALYSVPFLLVNRVFALTFRLAQVMFPKASAMASQGRHDELLQTYLQATRYVVFLNATLSLLLAGFAPELLRYWAGKAFGVEAVQVMVLIVGAVFADSLTNLPSLVNDGLGRPRNSGISALLRALVGFAAAWFAIRWAGILGAAWALLTVSTLAMLLFNAYVHRHSLRVALADVWRQGLAPSAPLFALALAAAAVAPSRALLAPLPFVGLGLAIVVVVAAYGWRSVMLPMHRERLLTVLRRRRSGQA